MKALQPTFALLLICLFSTTSFSQNLFQEGTVWNIGAVYWSFPPFQETISVKVEGDTLIDNVLYQKVYESRDSLNLIWEASGEYVREEDDQKVYYKDGSDPELLLYDFSLEVGDTFPVTSYLVSSCYAEVIALDTLTLLNGEQRRRWTLRNPGAFIDNYFEESHWIEGIGSTRGVIRHVAAMGYCAEHYPYFTQCHYVNGEMFYMNEFLSTTCWLVTSSKDVQEGTNDIAVSPNPTRSDVLVTSKHADRTIDNLRLYAASGQLLQEVVLHAASGTMSLENYPAGVYYLLTQDDTGMLSSTKLIKLE